MEHGTCNTLNNVKTQTTILSSPKFIDYINKAKSETTINAILSKQSHSETKKKMEPTQPLHPPRRELNDDDSCSIWSPRRMINTPALKAAGDGVYKLSSAIQTVAWKSRGAF